MILLSVKRVTRGFTMLQSILFIVVGLFVFVLAFKLFMFVLEFAWSITESVLNFVFSFIGKFIQIAIVLWLLSLVASFVFGLMF